jgi:hypothetical protein
MRVWHLLFEKWTLQKRVKGELNSPLWVLEASKEVDLLHFCIPSLFELTELSESQRLYYQFLYL